MGLERQNTWYARYRYALTLLLIAAVATAATVYGLRRIQDRIIPEADRSLRAVLPRAEWVQVIRAQPKIEIPITHISRAADEEPAMFALFQTGARFGAQAPATGPDLFFNVRYRPTGAEHGRVTRYGYDLETGTLGRDGDWAVLPPEFRLWMRRMDARVPDKDYGIMRSEGRKVVAPLPEGQTAE